MRRNKKKGVYTNKTIKSCPCCTRICVICKGACKMDVIADIDEESIAVNHPPSNRKLKKHHVGVGSFKRGRAFALNTKHRKSSWQITEPGSRCSKKNIMKNEMNEHLMLFEIMKITQT